MSRLAVDEININLYSLVQIYIIHNNQNVTVIYAKVFFVVVTFHHNTKKLHFNLTQTQTHEIQLVTARIPQKVYTDVDR